MQVSSLIILVLYAFAKDVWCRQHPLFYNSNYEERIVGGYEDAAQNNPYIVSIQFQDANQQYSQCGGSIISEYYILTAAHCTIGKVAATIRAGSSKANSGGQQYTSSQIIPHPSYNSITLNYDVAVIRTSRPIRLDRITTNVVKLAGQECDVKPGTNIKVSGWGATMETSNSNPNLMSVVVTTISSDICSRQVGQDIAPCQICASVPGGGKDSCRGDSGGPAIVASTPRSEYTRTACSLRIGEQVGIVSFGYGCARPGQPGVYTKVSCAGVRSWIKRTTGV